MKTQTNPHKTKNKNEHDNLTQLETKREHKESHQKKGSPVHKYPVFTKGPEKGSTPRCVLEGMAKTIKPKLKWELKVNKIKPR